jgi:hypothetical protein
MIEFQICDDCINDHLDDVHPINPASDYETGVRDGFREGVEFALQKMNDFATTVSDEEFGVV